MRLETWLLQKNNQRKRCKRDFNHNKTEVVQLLITKKADIQILNILGEAV